MSMTKQHSTTVSWRLVPASWWERILCKVTFGALGRSAYICRYEVEMITYYPCEHFEGRVTVKGSRFTPAPREGWGFHDPINCRCVVMPIREVKNA